MNYRRIFLSFVATLFCLSSLTAQQVPYGINYQAVARDNYGGELANRQIDVRFSIRSGSITGNLEYQEVHSGIVTSAFGVFNAIIGSGAFVGGDNELFKDIAWETDPHYLVVEIRFGADFLNMGSMQFLTVPYALYAARSLEPGPEGPPGPPGDPASDDQTLSFDGENLEISGGNFVNMAAFLEVNDPDSDPENEIQDLVLTNDMLKITNNVDAHEYDLSVYKDNTDEQTLNFEASNNQLSISNGNSTSLSALVNTDNQQLIYDENTYELSIDRGNSVSLGSVVAFRSSINSTIAVPDNTPTRLVFDGQIFDEASNYDNSTGEFLVPANGIYTLSVVISIPIDDFTVSVMVNGSEYEPIIRPTTPSGTYRENITMRLFDGNIVTISVIQTNGFSIPITYGYFSGFRVY